MPMVLAKRTYDYLLKNGYQKATFRVIKDEVHQYKKYDVFAIICAWLDSSGETTEFVLDQQDKKYIAKQARMNETSGLIYSLSYEGGEQNKAIECFRRAKEDILNEADLWFTLGIKLFANASRKEALYSFSQATDPNFIVHFVSMVWIGHINDLFNNREVALEWYKKALEEFPGFPVQHDNWGIIIDKKWVEERLKTPFKGIK
jgi:tetratricopeptide (TPR) repeat protein